jgi:hypothetical protein
VRDAQLSQLRAKEVEAADKVRAANERVAAKWSARCWHRPSASGPREAQRQLGRGTRSLGCRERAQEAGADRRADRLLPGAQGQGVWLPVQDWTDYKATGQLLGTGDDVLIQFQLVKHYPSGSVIEVRTITKPVAGTVKVYLDGVEQLSGWSVDPTTGLITFGTAPVLDVEVTADFEFDVPVRFDTDHMAVTIESYRLHAWQQIPIVELRT